MTIEKALAIGLSGNEVSKELTGTSEVSVGRTVVAAGSGAVIGTLASGAATVGLGVAAAPVAVPLAIAGGVVAGIASLFD